MAGLKKTNYMLYIFLSSMLFIYMIAFASVYIQSPGLFSDRGILPAKVVTEPMPKSWAEWVEQMSLLRFSSLFGLSVSRGLELCAIIGVLLCLLSLNFSFFKNKVTYAFLWLLYFSIYQAGQTFLWFQWDILLLETGFLCICSAPLLGYPNFNQKRKTSFTRSSSRIYIHLIRWLLFRLMFCSGVVKLTSGCPTWWGLTALHWHYQSQCIPTPLAWYFHFLPEWWQKWCVVATYVIEIAIPFLFFVPIRALRKFCFLSQVLLQVLIILTGNYNFFNLLTIALSLSLLSYDLSQSTKKSYVFDFLFSGTVIVGLIYFTTKYFSLHFDSVGKIHSKINFTPEEFNSFLSHIVPISMWLGGVILFWEIIKSYLRCLKRPSHFRDFLSCSVATVFALFVFSSSLISFAVVHRPSKDALPTSVKELHLRHQAFHITNSYGLFRHMTGVGGRPELIIEGSTSLQGPWQEYEFYYKPGDVSRPPPIVAPHQPRLDWQMWFAALSSHEYQPWLINTVYRLLQNEPEVIKLIEKSPFTTAAPKFVRIMKYRYQFMPDKKSRSWWYREKPEIYLDPVSLDTQWLQQHASQQKLISKVKTTVDKNQVAQMLLLLRNFVESYSLNGFYFVAVILVTQIMGRAMLTQSVF